MGKRRHWYHCTQYHKEPEWCAIRRPPLIRASTEPLTPRLCVSDTVARALSACWWTRDVGVYVTEERRTVPPSGVGDQVLTGERWIIPPVRLSLVGMIPIAAIEMAQDGLEPWQTDDRDTVWWRRSEKLRRMVQVVCEHLPQAHEAWVGKFADSCVGLFGDRIKSHVEAA